MTSMIKSSPSTSESLTPILSYSPTWVTRNGRGWSPTISKNTACSWWRSGCSRRYESCACRPWSDARTVNCVRSSPCCFLELGATSSKSCTTVLFLRASYSRSRSWWRANLWVDWSKNAWNRNYCCPTSCDQCNEWLFPIFIIRMNHESWTNSTKIKNLITTIATLPIFIIIHHHLKFTY